MCGFAAGQKHDFHDLDQLLGFLSGGGFAGITLVIEELFDICFQPI
jgi:hypothetical protein